MAEQLPPPPTLAELGSRGPVSLFVDFDGTLVPIAPTPSAIAVPSGLAARLDALSVSLAGRFALVSGRSIGDLEEHLGSLSIAHAGSHGASRIRADGSRIGQAPEKLEQSVINRLKEFADQHSLLYEAKTHGGALHYRAAPSAQDDVRAFARQLAREQGLAVKLGKGVAELVQPGANKGAAVRAFMIEEPFCNSLAVFIGDDVTDEDGFITAAEHGGFGIAVGERESAAAKYHLDSVAAVHHWLGL